MVNRDLIGKPLATFSYTIERSKIRELVGAIGDPNPIYRSVEAAHAAGYLDTPIPPTFPTLFSFWGHQDGFSTLKSLNVPQPRVLHGEEEYQYLAPMYPGDTVTGTLTITGIEEKHGKSGTMELVSFEIDYVNQRGEDVLHSRQLAIIR